MVAWPDQEPQKYIFDDLERNGIEEVISAEATAVVSDPVDVDGDQGGAEATDTATDTETSTVGTEANGESKSETAESKPPAKLGAKRKSRGK